MIYDEFADHDDLEKYNDLMEFDYRWEDAGVDEASVDAAGYEYPEFTYEVPRADVAAVIKWCLVHFCAKEPNEELDKYIDERFWGLYDKYYNYIHDAFKDEAFEVMVNST